MFRKILGFSAVALLTTASFASTFDAAVGWAGSGPHRAGLVIDWNDGLSPASVVWGYRWADGTTPNAEQMLLDIVRADTRLFAKVGEPGGFGTPVFGIGYDANAANGFGITTAGAFDADGIAVVDQGSMDAQGPVDGGVASFAGDRYAEGWWNSFWFQYDSASDPFAPGGAWSDGFGLKGETLSDGEFVGLSFAPGFNGSAPNNPVPEPASALLALCGIRFIGRRYRVEGGRP